MAQDPGRVFPGKRMAGQHGNVTRTTQTLTVVRVDAERGLLLVKGCVPGADGGHIIVRPAAKPARARRRRRGRDDGSQAHQRSRPAGGHRRRLGRAVRARLQRGADPPGGHRVPGQRAQRQPRAEGPRRRQQVAHASRGRRRAPAARARARPAARCGAAAAGSSRTRPTRISRRRSIARCIARVSRRSCRSWCARTGCR